MFADAGLRHTPEPVYVRFAMLGLFSLGIGLALLGAGLQLWSRQLSLDAHTAGNLFLALAGGLLAAFFPSRKAAESMGSGIRVLLIVSGILAAVDLAAMSLLYDTARLFGPMFVLGAVLGGFVGAVAGLLAQILTSRRVHEIFNLAGTSFCLGGLTGCLTIRVLAGFVSVDWILRFMAVLPLLAVVAILRVGQFRFQPSKALRAPTGGFRALSPSFFLLHGSLLLQAAAYGIAACWLTVYLSRALGLASRGSLTILLVFWAALTVGRAASVRMPALGDSLLSLVGPTAVSCLGCVFLLQTAQSSGAAVGVALWGFGMGSLHPLTLRMLRRRYTVSRQQVRLSALLFSSLASALVACWPVGRFSGVFGIELVIWAPLVCSLAAATALLVLVIENRVSGESALA